jgi:hypothetical protein
MESQENTDRWQDAPLNLYLAVVLLILALLATAFN